MALKPDRNILSTADYFMNVTGDRGLVAVSTSGTAWPQGAAKDDSNRLAEIAASTSGRRPVGLLLHDVVNIDQSRQILNPHKAEHQIGDAVPLVTRGRVVTNNVGVGQASGSDVVPTDAYLGPNGVLYSDNYASSGWPRVGKFMTVQDADGYCEVDIDVLQQSPDYT